ncbi:MAG: sterol desaturase family protein [Deltaproteobacteria bacterium]|nr:MAG: sterol desaturase family protein [Deltaproteobacteria bacterium]
MLRTLRWPWRVLAIRRQIMNATTQIQATLPTIGIIFGTMAILAIVEAVVPLHSRKRWGRTRLGPNLALTVITILINLPLNVALTLALIWLDSIGFGLRQWLRIGPIGGVALAVLALDFAFYMAHVAMHKIALFWRFHRVHHTDPFVDVTTTIRQHPGEGLIRYLFVASTAIVTCASPLGFAVYRLWFVLNALLEHANLRVPTRIDTIASLMVSTPNMHKVHHSRNQRETDSNYGNIFSLFDRLFSTFTPSILGMRIEYGLDGHDAHEAQTTAGLLAMPFAKQGPSAVAVERPATARG